MGEAVISKVRRRRCNRAPATGTARAEAIMRVVLICAIAFGLAGTAQAETTTERSSSILIFPKVIVDGTRDTLIQISNTNNSMVHAHCFYVNAAPFCVGTGDCVLGTCSGECAPQWIEIDFNIMLTKQQPTHWSADRGRQIDANAEQCTDAPIFSECDAAGLSPGRIPPVSSVPFAGELRCIEVDPSGAPLSGNHLKGEATIVSTDGDASKYNAVGLLGEPFTNNGDETLCLGGGVSDECPSGAEYEGCGEVLYLDHMADLADSLLFGPTSLVETELTLVPCRADFEGQLPTRVNVNFLVFNEFEQRLSTSFVVDCWATVFLGDINNIFRIAALETRFVSTHFRTSNDSISGIVGVAEEYHRLGEQTTRAAFNLHERGTRPVTDFIYLPEGP
jgi:hypothetical protein